MFPKARVHLLVLAKKPSTLYQCKDIRSVKLSMLSDLKKMHDLAIEIIENPVVQRAADGHSFMVGFHVNPSLTPLHLHIVSQDFDSKALTSKKHPNSFVEPDFFIDIDRVLTWMHRGDIPALHLSSAKAAEALLKKDLRCHRCRKMCADMPALKAHITQCKVKINFT